MKVFLVLFVALSLFSSCDKNDISNNIELSNLTTLEGENGLTYDESWSKWTNLKKENGESYIYQTTVKSWTGWGYTTELKIVNGRVTSRIFQEFQRDQSTGEIVIKDSYNENEKELGSHAKGATPLTIDELYNSCAGDYLVIDDENNTLYFQTTPTGLMTLCGFVPDNCADDCFEGISISAFDWIE
jgi:hypothetical protein